MIDPRSAGRRIAVLGLAVALGVAGCRSAGLVRSDDVPGVERFGEDAVVIVVGVVDLRPDDVDENLLTALGRPMRLDRGPEGDARILSAGAGAAAALSLIDPRDPLEHLLRPRNPIEATQALGWRTNVLEVAPTLASLPEWAAAMRAAPTIRIGSIRDSLPALGEVGPGRNWQVVLVDPFARDTAPFQPQPGRRDEAGQAWLTSVLGPWIEEMSTGPLADRLHVVVAGIPRSPLRSQRVRAQPVAGPTPEGLHVPVLWRAPKSSRPWTVSPRTGTVALHELLANAQGRAVSNGPFFGAWWNENSGGIHLRLDRRAWSETTGDSVAIEAWIVGDGPWRSDEPAVLEAHRSTLDSLALALLFDGEAPHLWVAARGSEGVDFVDLEFVGEQIADAVTPWALEDIDLVRTQSPTSIRFVLAAEPQGDGALVDLGWPCRTVEIRVYESFADAILLGTPFHLGAGNDFDAMGNLRLSPFSRSFWRCFTGVAPARADDWWRTAAVGVHLRRTTPGTLPEPASWDEES